MKGKRIGEINAFPRVIGCRANTYLKKQPIDKYYKTIKDKVDEVTEYIGIAANEPKWIPGWTVAELDERFNRENIAQIV